MGTRALGPDPLRLRREPLPLDPAGDRDPALHRRGRRRDGGGAAHIDATRVPGRRHQPQRPVPDRRHPARLPAALQAGSRGVRRRARSRPARRGARSRQPAAGPPRPPPRSRSGEHRDRLRRRRARQQLGGDALRRPCRLLPNGQRAEIPARRWHRDRHRGARCRRALRLGRTRAGSGARRDPRRAARRRRAGRARRPQVPDQEHDRLQALRVPRRGRATGDLQAPA